MLNQQMETRGGKRKGGVMISRTHIAVQYITTIPGLSVQRMGSGSHKKGSNKPIQARMD